MSALELRGENGEVLLSDQSFTIDVIDLLSGPDSALVCIWNDNVWNRAGEEKHSHLSLEAADPAATVTVQFRDLDEPVPKITHYWFGCNPLFFRPLPSQGLALIAAATADGPGEVLARLDYRRGLWLVEWRKASRFDQLYFSAASPPRSHDERRGRLSPLADQASLGEY